ncbi:MAG: hypothetical protein AABZ64_17590, partial [Nitrospinota bacterium]
MESQGAGTGQWALRARIAALSALTLFLEMLLVRWIGTEVRIFAYLQNGVLVCCFMGLGLGAMRSRAPARLLPGVLGLILIALFIRDPFRWHLSELVTQGLAAIEETPIWGRVLESAGALSSPRVRLELALAAIGATTLILGAVAAAFHPLGQWLGRWLDEDPRPLKAYTSNLLGSLAGIALFDAATAAETPPRLWLAAAGVGLALLAPVSEEPRWARRAAALLALLWPLACPGSGERVAWSPYQKLEALPLWDVDGRTGRPQVCGEVIRVNNTGFQAMVDLDPARWAERPDLYPPKEAEVSHYVLPYRIVGPRERVLVVGAGAGNDVAAALRAGAGRVHAVEIDPVVLRWGMERHPGRPYASSRVERTVDDARAFFRRDRGAYAL